MRCSIDYDAFIFLRILSHNDPPPHHHTSGIVFYSFRNVLAGSQLRPGQGPCHAQPHATACPAHVFARVLPHGSGSTLYFKLRQVSRPYQIVLGDPNLGIGAIPHPPSRFPTPPTRFCFEDPKSWKQTLCFPRFA